MTHQFTILHFISGIKSGGVEAYLETHMGALRGQGITCYVAYQHQAYPTSLHRLEQAGCICIQIPSKQRHPLGNIVASMRLINRLRPTIVEGHEDLANGFPLLAAWLTHAHIRIAHTHSSGSDFTAWKPMITLLKYSVRWLATDLVACSTHAGHYLYGRRHFSVLTNTIDVTHFHFDMNERKQLRQTLHLENYLVLGSVGRLTQVKNHAKLFDIVRTFKQRGQRVKLVLIGDGELREQLEQQAQQLELDDDVLFLGVIKDVARYYAMLDALVIPSFYEGGPIVALEAQAAGLPVVMSDRVDQDLVLLPTTQIVPLTATADDWRDRITQVVAVTDRARGQLMLRGSRYDQTAVRAKMLTYYQSILAGDENQ